MGQGPMAEYYCIEVLAPIRITVIIQLHFLIFGKEVDNFYQKKQFEKLNLWFLQILEDFLYKQFP